MRRRLVVGKKGESALENEKRKVKNISGLIYLLFQTSAIKYIVAIILFCLVLSRNISQPPTDDNGQTTKKEQTHKADMGMIVYGTARKKEKTAALVSEAIHAGFRHIATGSVHHEKYNESAVGVGWKIAAKDIGLVREDLFIQTMFVPVGNSDWVEWHHDGIDKQRSIKEQVNASIHSSLSCLQTSYLDAVLYHNFRNKLDSAEQVLEAWSVLEGFVDRGLIRYIGITNCHDIPFLENLYRKARIKPTIVQNRFHANRNFGVPLGPFLKEKQIKSQLFWTLTGNGKTLHSDVVKRLAQKFNLTPQTFMYAFLLSLGDTPLIGTTKRQHMEEDLAVSKNFDFGRHTHFNESKFIDHEAMQEFSNALGQPDLLASLNKY